VCEVGEGDVHRASIIEKKYYLAVWAFLRRQGDLSM